MKLVQINSTCGVGSTGKICVAISELLNERNVENYIMYSVSGTSYQQGKKYASRLYLKSQALRSRIQGNNGFNAKLSTKKLIRELNEIRPDIVHLHNLHSNDCNIKLLLTYLSQNKIKTYWTFHDCWTFTGYCTYFTIAKCEKWKSECKECPQRKKSSWLFDRSSYVYKQKKKAFSGLALTIITPSEWLADLVKQSFLKDYPVKVIHNGIDLSIFKPTESDFRKKYGCEGKYILLGVAFGWGYRKGLDVFLELEKRLDKNYQIVLVGTDENVDKQLPENIISIHRTQNQTELAEIYTAADLFVQPTREENYPTVNMEAIACGTPVLTFKTGGSPEIIDDTCGMVVERNDIEAMKKEILKICEEKTFSREECLERAKNFNANDRFKEYIDLYFINEMYQKRNINNEK